MTWGAVSHFVAEITGPHKLAEALAPVSWLLMLFVR